MDDNQNTYNPISDGMSIKDLLANNNEQEHEQESEQEHEQEREQEREQIQEYKRKKPYKKEIKNKKSIQLRKHTLQKKNTYYRVAIELLILLTVYVLMSQEFSISFASKYIKYIQPQQDGSTAFSGIVIYGAILCIIFYISRMTVLNNIN
jgi:hypothetical protein